MEGQDETPGHVPAQEGDALRVNQLHNSNNNASPGGWLGRKGSRSLSPFGPRAPAGARRKLSYLERVVLELVESERTYVEDLHSIVMVSQPPPPRPSWARDTGWPALCLASQQHPLLPLCGAAWLPRPHRPWS